MSHLSPVSTNISILCNILFFWEGTEHDSWAILGNSKVILCLTPDFTLVTPAWRIISRPLLKKELPYSTDGIFHTRQATMYVGSKPNCLQKLWEIQDRHLSERKVLPSSTPLHTHPPPTFKNICSNLPLYNVLYFSYLLMLQIIAEGKQHSKFLLYWLWNRWFNNIMWWLASYRNPALYDSCQNQEQNFLNWLVIWGPQLTFP